MSPFGSPSPSLFLHPSNNIMATQDPRKTPNAWTDFMAKKLTKQLLNWWCWKNLMRLCGFNNFGFCRPEYELWNEIYNLNNYQKSVRQTKFADMMGTQKSSSFEKNWINVKHCYARTYMKCHLFENVARQPKNIYWTTQKCGNQKNIYWTTQKCAAAMKKHFLNL